MLVTFCALVVYYFVKSLEVEKEKTSLSYETATNVNTKSNRSFKLNENTGEEVSSIKALQKNKVNNLPPNKKISKIKNNESKSISFNIDTAFESSVYHSKFLNNYRDGNYKEAIKLGNNILKIPKKYASHYWYGNICHSTNIILGKIYFAMGDTEKAERFLL
ncbi:MAG: hypothetical protein CME66_10350, partial [Halobacteriovoraceae bacterium]|nr:hypothetical protein [Halobacteriovoraceae bacterium]